MAPAQPAVQARPARVIEINGTIRAPLVDKLRSALEPVDPDRFPAGVVILLNSPDAVRFATALAARALKSGTNHAERIRFIFRTAFSREPDAGELNMAGNWLQERSREGDAAWVQFCRAILNTNEFVHID